MKTTHVKTTKPSQETRRSFTWGVKTTDVSFMRMSEAEAAMDGSGGGGDCSAIAKFDKPRKTKPGSGNHR
jgi:hypothetical protein